MAVSTKTKNARIAARKAIKEGRDAVENARTRAEDARSSGFYTEEGTRNYIGGWVKDARGKVKRNLERIERQAREARQDAEKTLQKARSVPEAERATAAAILAPVISAAADNPEALIRAYERRAPNSLADRFILEDSIQVILDSGLGGPAFAETWERTRAATADAVTSEEERGAVEDLQAVEALEGYLSAAQTVAETDLEQIESGNGTQYSAALERQRHTLARYERETEESSKVRTVVGSNAEQDAEDAETIRKWREMQARKAEEGATDDAGEGSEGEGSEGEGGEGGEDSE